MRKLFLFMMVSLDGYIEGENHDLSWHNVDGEFNSFAAKQMQEMGAILFGRRTYELMRDFWPNETPTDENDKIIAEMMNSLPKIVVSKSLEKVEEAPNWKNVSLIKTNVVEEIKKLKEQSGKDIAVLGSNNLGVTLLEHHLLDELRIMINPVVIGKGTPLFVGITQKYDFHLVDTRQFTSGNMLLTYH